MRRSFLCVLFFAVLASGAAADQVTLKNGDRLSGDIVNGDGKTLLIKTEFAGDVTIQWDAIVGIESTQHLNLTLKDGTRLSGKITTTDGKFVVAGAPTPSAGPAPKDTIVAVRNDTEQKTFDVETEKMAHPKFTYFWSGAFDLGLALIAGTPPPPALRWTVLRCARRPATNLRCTRIPFMRITTLRFRLPRLRIYSRPGFGAT